jgi:hypothetical protein
MQMQKKDWNWNGNGMRSTDPEWWQWWQYVVVDAEQQVESVFVGVGKPTLPTYKSCHLLLRPPPPSAW